MKTANKYLLIAITAASIYSCKKNDSIQKLPSKTYLTKKTYGDILENYHYDNQNRLSRMEYIEPTYTSTTTVTMYDNKNNPTEYFVRASVTNSVSKYNATYDTQNRPLSIVRYDSINPTTYAQGSSLTFTYVGNKQIRTSSIPGSSNTSVLETIFGDDGNFAESKFTNSAGVTTTSFTWSGYDNKNSYEPLLPHITRGGILPSKNNQTTEVFTNLITGVASTYTASHQYNADNYVIQTTYAGTTAPLVINYTYEKR